MNFSTKSSLTGCGTHFLTMHVSDRCDDGFHTLTYRLTNTFLVCIKVHGS